ncbi:hypothetical protein DEO72_LG5g297 [Vigna unguiculata]|uniref:Uncharacterized protein n=1 Tax=Vigna unguiculata TaxID=3917 RepID=A0A4D6LGH0_VIGUN|nr:hypothetical protein DEO72_LG3g2220 [Vigna unguiculata]QCD92235.1 hypothetical protein DEO72_LG5g297 [Vigna unguiculata]
MAWSVEGVRDGGSCASEVCGTVGAVRDGGAELRWSSEKGGAMWCGAGDEMLAWSVGGVRDGGRCAGRWELCGTVALVVGEDEGWPEMVKLAEKSKKMSLYNEEIGVF